LAAARADEDAEDEDDDMRAQENQKLLDDINECQEKNNGNYLLFVYFDSIFSISYAVSLFKTR
jgi:hypothetical protein